MKRILLIDRDGTLIQEAPPTYQIDQLEKLVFYPAVFQYLSRIVQELDYELIMITNQDGLGTSSFPEEDFWPIQQHIIRSFANEGITFKAVYIDRTLPHENAPTRKPGTAMLTDYINNPEYDLTQSFVIGDRLTDVQLAKNLGAKAIYMKQEEGLGGSASDGIEALQHVVALETTQWSEIYAFLKAGLRQVSLERNTQETKIKIDLNMDGHGVAAIHTGIAFLIICSIKLPAMVK